MRVSMYIARYVYNITNSEYHVFCETEMYLKNVVHGIYIYMRSVYYNYINIWEKREHQAPSTEHRWNAWKRFFAQWSANLVEYQKLYGCALEDCVRTLSVQRQTMMYFLYHQYHLFVLCLPETENTVCLSVRYMAYDLCNMWCVCGAYIRISP